MSEANSASSAPCPSVAQAYHDPLRREPPYWHTFTTNAKMRWYNRRILDVLVEEFRDRTKYYYTWAIHRGLLKINGQKVLPTRLVQNGDVITHTAHKHEPPITSDPVRILFRDDIQGRVVVVKPGSVPVHPAGRYLRHTLLELVKSDHGIEKVFTANRLDRLTSGVMVASTTTKDVKSLAADFESGRVRKAYVCRVRGRFPEAETTCEEPLLSLDRQTGVVISHPLGRPAKTIFNRLSYDKETDTSVLFCRPITGRTHQIRVHAQLLGHVIPNDPIYAHPIWQTYDPAFLKDVPVPSTSDTRDTFKTSNAHQVTAQIQAKAVKDLACTPECSTIIEALKNSKDEGEDWSRLKDEVRFAQWNQQEGWLDGDSVSGVNGGPAQGAISTNAEENELGYCPECFLPLLPDPPPEALFIYLHAIRYETDEWSFEDEMPWWSRGGWTKPGAMRRAQESRAQGDVVRPPRLQLVSEFESKGGGGELRDGTATGASLSRIADRMPHEGENLDESSATLTQNTSALSLSPAAPTAASVPFSPLLTRPTQSHSLAGSSASSQALRDVPLLLEIFAGLDDFVSHDLQVRLGNPATSTSILTAVHSGYLIVPTQLTSSTMELPHLPFINGQHILIGKRRIPEDLLDRLLQDRQLLGTRKQSRGKQEAKAKARRVLDAPIKDDKRPAPELVKRTLTGQVESEERLLSLIHEMWVENKASFDTGLNAWMKYCRAIGTPGRDEAKWTYRATVERSVYKLPTLVGSDICQYFGDQIWARLNGPLTMQGDVPHPVCLTACDLDVVCSFVPWLDVPAMKPVMRSGLERSTYGKAWDCNPPGSLVLTIKLPFRPQAPHAPHRPPPSISKEKSGAEGSTALARYRAYTLASLLPLPMTTTDVRLWEPCVGTGSIVIELCALLQSRALTGHVFGSDVDDETILAARRVSQASGWEEGVEIDGISAHYRCLDLKDESELHRWFDFPSDESHSRDDDRNVLDGIVVDLPWGIRELSHGLLAALYAHFLQSCLHFLKAYHYAVVMTLELKTLQRALIEVEGVVRRRGDQRWMMKMEKLVLDEEIVNEEVRLQGEKQADELGGARTVEMGLRPAVVLLRKVPL